MESKQIEAIFALVGVVFMLLLISGISANVSYFNELVNEGNGIEGISTSNAESSLGYNITMLILTILALAFFIYVSVARWKEIKNIIPIQTKLN